MPPEPSTEDLKSSVDTLMDEESGERSLLPLESKEHHETKEVDLRTEIKMVGKLAAPAALNQLLGMLMGTVDIYFLGHINADSLAACALANLTFFGTGLFGLGLSSAMDTQCAQAFGAKNYKFYTESTIRTVVILTVLSFPLGAIWWNVEPILIGLGQHPGIAALASRYLRVLIPSIWFFFQTQTLTKFLQCQHIVRPPVVVSLVTNIMNIIFNTIFVRGAFGFAGWGFDGAAIATLISRMTAFVLLLATILIFKLHKNVWTGFSKEALSLPNVVTYMKLGIPGGLMMSLECFFFVASALMVGLIGPIQLAANEALFNTCGFTYMCPLGIGVAASVRVGYHLGAGNPQGAKISSRICAIAAMCFMLMTATVMVIFRNKLGYFFTDDEQVVGMMASVYPLAALFQVFDGLGAVSGGCLRGMGRQLIGAVANFVGPWLVALPLGACFAFAVHLGIVGVWIGISIGLALLSSVQGYYVFFHAKWDEESKKAIQNASIKDVPSSNGVELQEVTPSSSSSSENGDGEC